MSRVFVSHLPQNLPLAVQFSPPSDATVHPPVSGTHPYKNKDPTCMPPDMRYGCKMVDGVMHVYTSTETMDK